ncbi:MAG: PSD1 and planctomycete cytochrome C domain-containing protein [Deltaproteobacteria bacterium]|nr:PSD1 and planctomycete cytochrome C domain-containing protein [Deltaproteobacteria bacterium]
MPCVSFFAILSLLAAPTDGAATAVQENQEVFARQVLPALSRTCLPCHGGVRTKGGLNMKSAAALAELVVPGDAEESDLYQRIVTHDVDDRMPPEGPRLDAAAVIALRTWIDGGANWAPHGSFTDLDSPPLEGIDAYIGQRLAQHSLSFNTQADRHTLVRRVSFDLTGLPPDGLTVSRFIDDQHPGAYARMVDRFLASPAYGQRWGKYWLDTAGYADSNGYYDADTDRPLAFHYRDWVVDSLNRDQPFDAFVRQQLAGDELANYQPKGDITADMVPLLTATHFLRNASDGTGESDGNAQERQRDRLVVLEGTLDLVGGALMGATFACAKCHDHPFEPISQHDYYALQAVFASAFEDDDGRWKKPAQRTVVATTRATNRRYERKAAPYKAKIAELQAQLVAPARAIKLRLDMEHLAKLDASDRQEAEALLSCTVRSKDQEKRFQSLGFGADNDYPRFARNNAAFKQQLVRIETQVNPIRAQMPKAPPQLSILADTGGRTPLPHTLKLRGVYTEPGQVVQPSAPIGLAAQPDVLHIDRYARANTSGRRSAFAFWLTNAAAPLLARVTVNRMWARFFGQGLVPTLDNLGQSAAQPSHPALLDALARAFVHGGWSRKAFHRMVLNSRTYQQASTPNDGALAADPDNRLLWRMPLRRLDAESVRDAMLAVSGRLDRTQGGPYVPTVRTDNGVEIKPDNPGQNRRSIYLQHRRSQVHGFLATFDAPAINTSCPSRMSSTVPSQSLSMLNSEFALRTAQGLANRVLPLVKEDKTGLVDSVHQLFNLVLARPPQPAESNAALAYVHAQTDTHVALREVAQMLVGSNAFLYLE